MSKVSKISLENFRAFKDKTIFDMQNGNQAADFICIFGENGSGKTSFFDACEWLMTGTVGYLESAYSKEHAVEGGKILRNFYGGNKAEVGICLDNGKAFWGTLKIRADAKSDLKPPDLVDENRKKIVNAGFNKYLMLPHWGIDSFVSARTPEAKYDEWGDYWDSDGNQRIIFNNIYLLRKKCKQMLMTYEETLKNVDEELKKCTLTTDNIHHINTLLAKILYYDRKGIVSVSYLDEYTDYLPKLQKLLYEELPQLKNELNTNFHNFETRESDLLFLLNNFKENEKRSNEIELSNKWSKLAKNYLDKCYKKELLVMKENELEEKNIALSKKYHEYLKYISIGKAIIEEAFSIMSLKKQIVIWQDNEKLLSEECAKQNNCLDILKEKIKVLSENKEIVKNKYVSIKEQVDIINYEKQKMKNKNMIIQSLLLRLNDTNNQKRQIELALEQLQVAKINEHTTVEYLDNIILDTSEYYKSIEELSSLYRESLVQNINKISKLDKKLADLQLTYQNLSGTIDNLDYLLIQIKHYIATCECNFCPVCQTEFVDKNELINKIDITEQRKNLYRIMDSVKETEGELSDTKKEKLELVSAWNACIEDIKHRLQRDVSNILVENNKIVFEIENLRNEIQEAYKKVRLLFVEYGNEHDFKEDEEFIKLDYFVDHCDFLITQMDEKIRSKEIEIENAQKDYENTKIKHDQINSQILNAISQYNDYFTYVDNVEISSFLSSQEIKDWETLCELVDSYKKMMQDLTASKASLQTELQNYAEIDIGKKSLYERIFERFIVEKNSVAFTSNYKSRYHNIFGYKKYNLARIRDSLAKLSIEKGAYIETFDSINEFLCNINYKNFVEKHKLLKGHL